MVYPIAVDPRAGRIVAAGETLREQCEAGRLPAAQYDAVVPDFDLTLEGCPVAWPIRKSGALGNWGLGRETLLDLARQGMVKVGAYDGKRRTWVISYLSAKLQAQVHSGVLEVVTRDAGSGTLDVRYVDVRDRRVKTVWHRSSHDAGTGGSDLLNAFLGGRRFDFPKSVCAVRDTIAAVSSDPAAVILDFFAGSGTTLHSVALLNAQDGGRRQCILVTNNDVSDLEATALNAKGCYLGDA